MSSVSIVIPCCNEEEALALLPERLFPVVARVQATRPVEIVLINDGSTDRTAQIIESLSVEYPTMAITTAHHARNRGLGAALQTGTRRASGNIVVMLDADGTYPFEIIEPLIDAIDGGADVSTASPYHRHGNVAGVSRFRVAISKGASLLYRMLVDPRIATYTAMVRAYRAEVIVETDTSVPGFLYVAQILVEARRRDATVVEIPAVLHQREVGVSKARVVQITISHLRYMRHLLRLRVTGQFWLARQQPPPEPVVHGDLEMPLDVEREVSGHVLAKR